MVMAHIVNNLCRKTLNYPLDTIMATTRRVVAIGMFGLSLISIIVKIVTKVFVITYITENYQIGVSKSLKMFHSANLHPQPKL